jgi:hypothetical protein
MTVAVAQKYSVPGFASGGIAGLGNQITGSYNATQDAMVKAMQQALVDAITKAVAAAAAAVSAKGASSAGAPAANVAAMQAAAAAHGWTGQQWTDLVNLEMQEAGFRLNAQNPTSGAYGMAQFINGPSEYAQYGGNASTAAGQAAAMMNYIAQRYGSPAAAWAHEVAFNWYDKGGLITEPVVGFGTQTGKHYGFAGSGPEMVIPMGGQPGGDKTAALLSRICDQLDRLTGVAAAIPAGVGSHMGAAIGGASAAASFRTRYPHGGS